MQIGRSHKWYYDKGEWKDKKITPDLWEIRYELPNEGLVKHQRDPAPQWAPVIIGIF